MNEQERAYNIEEFAAGASFINPGESMPAKVGTVAPDFEATATKATSKSRSIPPPNNIGASAAI